MQYVDGELYIVFLYVASSCHSELKKRIGKPQNHAHTRTTPSVDSELHTLSVDQVTELCERYLYDLHQNCATLAHHMEHVVSSPPATGGIHDTRDVENDFP
ncbi:hypothetical protein BaRGS_00016315 [Batillaria attramentaria]|uniref:Uncharacterized protein n=1 Tax=Batillaria attramentaria TaxID=370345 RepID=A0ABD0KZ57_9CAEN